MSYKNELYSQVKQLATDAKEYVENRVELEVLKSSDKISQGIAITIVILMASAIALLSVALLLVAGANALNTYLNSNTMGYVYVGIVSLLLIAPIIYFGKRSLKNAIINQILKNIDND